MTVLSLHSHLHWSFDIIMVDIAWSELALKSDYHLCNSSAYFLGAIFSQFIEIIRFGLMLLFCLRQVGLIQRSCLSISLSVIHTFLFFSRKKRKVLRLQILICLIRPSLNCLINDSKRLPRGNPNSSLSNTTKPMFLESLMQTKAVMSIFRFWHPQPQPQSNFWWKITANCGWTPIFLLTIYEISWARARLCTKLVLDWILSDFISQYKYIKVRN